MDMGACFTKWEAENPTTTTAGSAAGGASLRGRVFNSATKGKKTLFNIRLLDEADNQSEMIVTNKKENEGAVVIWVPTADLCTPAPEMMDQVIFEDCTESKSEDGRVFINATAVRVDVPWNKSARVPPELELLPLPLPETGRGEPFVIYAAPQTPVVIPGEPGLHRRTELGSTTTATKGKKKERRLFVTFMQRQWEKHADARPDMPKFTMKATIWDNQCGQLFGNKLSLEHWTLMIKSNPVPFHASVRVDHEYTIPPHTNLSILAIQWDLRTYLESSCLELRPAEMKKLVPKTAATGGDTSGGSDIVNVSDTGVVPVGSQWRYFVVSASRATEFAKLAEPMVLFAVRLPPATATATTAATATATATATAAESPLKKSRK